MVIKINQKKNLQKYRRKCEQAQYSDTKSRSLITLFIIVGVILAIVAGYMYLMKQKNIVSEGGTSIQGGVSIESIPGLTESSAEYTSLQKEQNNQNAARAQRTGRSAIPTHYPWCSIGQFKRF